MQNEGWHVGALRQNQGIIRNKRKTIGEIRGWIAVFVVVMYLVIREFALELAVLGLLALENLEHMLALWHQQFTWIATLIVAYCFRSRGTTGRRISKSPS